MNLRRIQIEPTTRCTRSCRFCRPGVTAPEDLSVSHHERVLRHLADAGWAGAIHYSGFGEPTLHRSFCDFVEAARKRFPSCQISLYTNGDPLTAEMLMRLRVLDYIAWDVYAYDDTAARMGEIVARSGFPPKHFRVVDQVAHPIKKISRAGALWKADVTRLSESCKRPCTNPRTQLVITADGNWTLCCNDMRRRKQWPGTWSLRGLLRNLDYSRTVETISRRRGDFFVCRECEQPGTGNSWEGGGPARFCPGIDETRFWTASDIEQAAPPQAVSP